MDQTSLSPSVRLSLWGDGGGRLGGSVTAPPCPCYFKSTVGSNAVTFSVTPATRSSKGIQKDLQSHSCLKTKTDTSTPGWSELETSVQKIEQSGAPSLCVFVDVTARRSDSELPRDQSHHQSRHLFDKRESCSLRSCAVILRSIVCTHATSTQDALIAHHISAFNDAND